MLLYNPLPNSDYKSFSFPVQCAMLKVIGAWPLANSKLENIKAWLYYAWSYTIIILITLTCLAQSMYIYKAWGDILTVTECGCTVLMGIQNMFRLIHITLKRQNMKNLLKNFVDNIWVSPKHEKTISRKCERDMIVLKIVSILLLILITMYVTLPLMDLLTQPSEKNIKELPYKMVFPYDTNNTYLYVITYALTSFAGFSVVCTLFAEDSLFGFFIAHTCGQYRLLHRDIDNIIINGRRNIIRNNIYLTTYNSDTIEREYKVLIDDIIRRHNITIKFCKDLERFFSPILLVNFMISSFLICMVGFQIVAVDSDMGDLTKLILYIISALSQLFILCRMGDTLIEHSMDTAWRFYACNWQDIINIRIHRRDRCERLEGLLHLTGFCEASIQKFSVLHIYGRYLILAIGRSQKPLQITAMKFWVLSLKSFTTITGASLSYFTLLQAVLKDEQRSMH